MPGKDRILVTEDDRAPWNTLSSAGSGTFSTPVNSVHFYDIFDFRTSIDVNRLIGGSGLFSDLASAQLLQPHDESGAVAASQFANLASELELTFPDFADRVNSSAAPGPDAIPFDRTFLDSFASVFSHAFADQDFGTVPVNLYDEWWNLRMPSDLAI